MFKRQPLTAIASARPRCPVNIRVQSIRFRSDIRPADRQPAQEKGSNTMPTNPAPEHTPTQHNQPSSGRSRQQRAAQVSEEVRMLNRGSTSATVSGNPSPYPTIRDKGVDPENLGGNGGPMAATDSAEREGPYNQSPGRVMRAGEGPDEARSEHSASGAILDPEDGGETLLRDGAARGKGNGSRAEREMEEDEDDGASDDLASDPMGESTANELTLLSQFDKQDKTAVSFEPEAVTRDEYLKLGQGGATIAGGNFAGVIEDRIKIVAEPTQDDFRYAPDIAKRMLKGELVSFKDEKEKADVLALVKKRRSRFSPLSSKSQDVMFDKFIRGTYPDLNAAPHKNKILNDVARTVSRNATYLNKDSTKLLRKIGSLLPSGAAPRKPAAAAPTK